MLFSTIGQIHVFLWMVGAGMAIGAVYTLFRALRRLLEAGFWLTLAADALFGLCAAIILVAALFLADYGRFRLYELLGAVLGAILFELGVAPPIRSLCIAAISILKRAVTRISGFRLIKVIFR